MVEGAFGLVLVTALILLVVVVGGFIVAAVARLTPATEPVSCDINLLSLECDRTTYCTANPTDVQCVEYCASVFQRPNRSNPAEPTYDPACASVVCEPTDLTRQCVCGFVVFDAVDQAEACDHQLCAGKLCLSDTKAYSIRNFDSGLYLSPRPQSQNTISAYLSMNMSVTPLGMVNGPEKAGVLVPVQLMTEQELATVVYPNTRIELFPQLLDMDFWALRHVSGTKYLIYWRQWQSLVVERGGGYMDTHPINTAGVHTPVPVPVDIEVQAVDGPLVVCRIGDALTDRWWTLYGRAIYSNARAATDNQLWRLTPHGSVNALPPSSAIAQQVRMPHAFRLRLAGTSWYYANSVGMYHRHFGLLKEGSEQDFMLYTGGTKRTQISCDYLTDDVPETEWVGQYMAIMATLVVSYGSRYMHPANNPGGYQAGSKESRAKRARGRIGIFLMALDRCYLARKLEDGTWQYLTCPNPDNLATFLFLSEPTKLAVFEIVTVHQDP